MEKNIFYLGLVTCLLTGGVAVADPVFDYTLHLPNITSGAEDNSVFTEYAFSWKGPLKFASAAGSACPTVCGPVVGGSTVTSGEPFAGFSFTSNGTSPEVLVKFSDFSGIDYAHSNTVTFTLIEPDSFWSNLGNGFSFPGGGNPGATFLATGGTSTVCSKCTVDISEESTATPEPRSSILLAMLVAVAGLVMQRRRRQAKTVS